MTDTAAEVCKKIARALNHKHITGADRIYALSLLGLTQRDVARYCDVSPASVSDAINDKITSYNIATGIAAISGIPMIKLWPCGKYADNRSQGERRPGRNRSNESKQGHHSATSAKCPSAASEEAA